MMINKRLIGTVSESKKYIAGNVILQWCSCLLYTSTISMLKWTDRRVSGMAG